MGLRPKASPSLVSTLRQAKPLHLAIGAVTLLLFLFTFFSSSSSSSSYGSPSTRSFAPPSYFSRLTGSGPKKPKIVHPIPAQIKAAEVKFSKMIASQSRSLSQAVAEYKRRYDRPPPPGFDEWYKFAVDNNAVIIDEYDQLMEDLQPFWLLSGEEIRKRCVDVGLLPSVDLVRVENGKTRTIDVNTGFDDAEVGARAKGFRVMLEKFQGAFWRLTHAFRLASA